MILDKSYHSQTFHINQNLRKSASLLFIVAIGLYSCREGYDSTQTQTPTYQPESAPDIYLAGITGNGVHPTATYWKNGYAIPLTDGSNYAEAFSIVVSGDDAFVAGYEYNGINNVAKYWKNAIAVPLTDGTSPAMAYSIALSRKDVYVAGFEGNPTTKIAKYWKNGKAVSLTDGTNDAEAHAIVVFGKDVYVAGDEYIGKNVVAKYWKNGKPISLTTDSTEGHAYAIAVSGNDIYVAGTEKNRCTGNMIAEYWKNGTVFKLTDGSNSARCNSITVSGDIVYAAGAEYKDGKFYVAKFWFNGESVDIIDSSNYSMANAIFVQDHDIYLAGEQLKGTSQHDSSVTLYWKNGSEALLQNPSNSGGYTNSVFIKSNYSQETEERRTVTYPNIIHPRNMGTQSLGGVSLVFSKKSKNTSKQKTTHKNNAPFIQKALSSSLFSNQGKHHATVQAKRK